MLAQLLPTAADIGSTVLSGVLLAEVLRLGSAADGYPSAGEPAGGTVGARPEDESYPVAHERARA